MNKIKKYFQKWDFMRIFRLVLAATLLIGYFYSSELFLLFGAVFLFLQAALNLGCPGGSCGSTPVSKDDTVFKFDKYKPQK